MPPFPNRIYSRHLFRPEADLEAAIVKMGIFQDILIYHDQPFEAEIVRCLENAGLFNLWLTVTTKEWA